MKISKSKHQLAQLLFEAGVTKFPNGANWAAQDKDFNGTRYVAYMYVDLPTRGGDSWSGLTHNSPAIKLSTLIPNWHQTVLSSDEFDQIVAETAPDADGWIEWGGGNSPVKDGVMIETRWSDGDLVCHANFGSQRQWDIVDYEPNIIAYRLHKHEKSLGELCGEAKEENKHEHIDAKPTIEQLAADYRSAKDYADRKQQEADAAKADAGAKLAELVEAGKEHGLLVSPIAENMTSQKLPFRGMTGD